MTGVNMKVPQPSVTGMAIPANLVVKNNQSDYYNNLKNARNKARQGLQQDYYRPGLKNKNTQAKLKTAAKVLLATITGTGLFLLAKKFLLKK